MKVNINTKVNAITRIEVISVVSIVIILLYLAFVSSTKTRKYTIISQCNENLYHISTGFRMWGLENDNKFPWHVKPEDGGTMDLPIECHFLVLSNYIIPKHLVCPADSKNQIHTNWHDFMRAPSNKISYFCSPVATIENPESILIGDCNIDGRPKVIFLNNISVSYVNPYPKWDDTRHNKSAGVVIGNIALANSSVHTVNSKNLAKLFKASINSKNSTTAIVKIQYP